LKLNATGDVVRTTPILRRLSGHVTWVTAANNAVFIDGVLDGVRCVTWERRDESRDRAYDLVINLEDDFSVAEFAASVSHSRLFGACVDSSRGVSYTPDARPWFDLSLISRFGKQRADELKLQNRMSYQELIFAALGWQFSGERYLLPAPAATALRGDVAIAPLAGPVWPMKNWAYYEDLRAQLERKGLAVNVLPKRPSLLEHLGDVSAHRCIVSGDSLPMHLALGLGIPCVTLFTCTSPWEIYHYGLQKRVISPLLEEFFYKRGLDPRATRAISIEAALNAVLEAIA
jgi:ADP-heptose:LPS heptosyltransferase